MKRIIEIPEGTANIDGKFPVYLPDVSEYYLQLLDDTGAVIGTTRNIKVVTGCSIRLHFTNSFGKLEGLNFKSQRNTVTKGSGWEAENTMLNPFFGGLNRSNIRSEEIFDVESQEYTEKELNWLDELVNSPAVWMERSVPNGLYESTEKQYVAISLQDSKILKKALYGSYLYKVNLSFVLSNSRRNLR